MLNRVIDRDDFFDYIEMAPHVIFAVAHQTEPILSNAVIVDLGARLLVVDAHSRPSAARRVVNFIHGRFRPPVDFVVNTHHHWDHWHGNSVYREAFPRAVFVAHPAARDGIARSGPHGDRQQYKLLLTRIRELRKQATAALGQDERESVSRQIAGLESYRAELDGFKRIVPELTVDKSMTLYGDAREVQLIHPGRAHTAGDLLVYLPQARAIATGDVAVAFTPFLDDGFPVEWADALRRVGEMSIDHVLLGHGRPEGRQWLTIMGDYLRDLVTETRRAIDAGLEVEEAATEVAQRLAPLYAEPFSQQYGTWQQGGPWSTGVLANVRRTYMLLLLPRSEEGLASARLG